MKGILKTAILVFVFALASCKKEPVVYSGGVGAPSPAGNACWDCIKEYLYSLPPDTALKQDSTLRPFMFTMCDFDSMMIYESQDGDTIFVKDGTTHHYFWNTKCQ